MEASKWDSGLEFLLPEHAARHVQVLRLQPQSKVMLFNGHGGEWLATVVSIGRRDVLVCLQAHRQVTRELPLDITLALGAPANDRMDFLIEKATELGVAAIQPLRCARSVLRLEDERAAKKVNHWQLVAASASEQCGRTKVPVVLPLQDYRQWLNHAKDFPGHKGVLGFSPTVSIFNWALNNVSASPASVCILSGPEGGLSPEEESLALSSGWSALGLGKRVLRAETAPLMAMSVLAACLEAH